jgi:hypothetical protein
MKRSRSSTGQSLPDATGPEMAITYFTPPPSVSLQVHKIARAVSLLTSFAVGVRSFTSERKGHGPIRSAARARIWVASANAAVRRPCLQWPKRADDVDVWP